MANITNLEQFLTDVATAIRTKKETTGQIPAENFDQEILSIETGVDTSDATAVADDIVYGKTAYVNGEKITGRISEQEGDIFHAGLTSDITDGDEFGNNVVVAKKLVKGSSVLRTGQNVQIDLVNRDLASAIGLTPEKIVSGNTIIGVEGTAETGTEANLQDKTISITENGQQTVVADENYDGLRQVLVNTNVSSTGQICKIFESTSEMQADGTKKEDDLGIIYNTIPGPWTGFETNVFYFPETVVLENAITSDNYYELNYTGSSAGSVMGMVMVNPSSVDIRLETDTSGMARASYTSNDGITYVKSGSDYGGFSGKWYYTDGVDIISKFIYSDCSQFEGLYIVKSQTDNTKINEYSMLQLQDTNRVIPQYKESIDVQPLLTVLAKYKSENNISTMYSTACIVHSNINEFKMYVHSIDSLHYAYPCRWFLYNNNELYIVPQGSVSSITEVTLNTSNNTYTTRTVTSLGTIGGRKVFSENIYDKPCVCISWVNSTNYETANLACHYDSTSGYYQYTTEKPSSLLYVIADTQFTLENSNQLKEGIIAYGKNSVVTGSMSNNGELNYASSTEEQVIPAGYTSGGTIAAYPVTEDEYNTCLNLTNQILGNGGN